MTATPLAFWALRDRPEWLDHEGETPVCAETDPELWFPEKGQATVGRRAKRLCRSCPLLDQCREWALAHPELAQWGIWGGLTEKERYALRRRNRISAAGVLGEAA